VQRQSPTSSEQSEQSRKRNPQASRPIDVPGKKTSYQSVKTEPPAKLTSIERKPPSKPSKPQAEQSRQQHKGIKNPSLKDNEFQRGEQRMTRLGAEDCSSPRLGYPNIHKTATNKPKQ